MKILLAIILIFITTQAMAMDFEIPFRCYKQTLIDEFAKVGIILDSENEDSHGFIENKGSQYIIHTYGRPSNLRPFIDIPLKVKRMKQ